MYSQKLEFMFRERGFRVEDPCPLSARNICYWHSRSLTKNGKTRSYAAQSLSKTLYGALCSLIYNKRHEGE